MFLSSLGLLFEKKFEIICKTVKVLKLKFGKKPWASKEHTFFFNSIGYGNELDLLITNFWNFLRNLPRSINETDQKTQKVN